MKNSIVYFDDAPTIEAAMRGAIDNLKKIGIRVFEYKKIDDNEFTVTTHGVSTKNFKAETTEYKYAYFDNSARLLDIAYTREKAQ